MRVFDSFIFFNELDLLELRLNILNDVVDYFVLTESPWTVSGNPKPLYYQENKDRFEKFNHKIIHNITEEIPNDYSVIFSFFSILTIIIWNFFLVIINNFMI
jgi:beta-1,4-mannosyl-glycoprotein beta-1,4-N-acetylglucosaminyltransferase